jgi:hypothetical protein
VADQRNLNMTFIADMAAELENDRRENVRKLSQAYDVSARTVYAALMRTAKLSKKSALWVKNGFPWRQRMGNSGRVIGRSDGGHDSLTV